MFNKEQLVVINQQLLLTYESMIELSNIHKHNKQNSLFAAQFAAEFAQIEAMRHKVKEVLDIIDNHIGYTKFDGQAYLDIPQKDGETWENIHIGTAEEIRKMATEKFGADDFGYVRLVTLGESN